LPEGEIGGTYADFWSRGQAGAAASGSVRNEVPHGDFSARASAPVSLGADAGIRLLTEGL
jgi:hypothetical protein